MRKSWFVCRVVAAWLAIVGGGVAAEPEAEPTDVRLFAAMEAGDIDVQFIANNAASANVIVTNRTDRPLRIELPAAFAGVPVLAQPGNFGQGNPLGGPGAGLNAAGNNFGVGGQGGGGQGVGGGFGGQGLNAAFNGGGVNGGAGGFFNVAPGKTRHLKVETVCLEHGKRDPTPRMKYAIRPIETLTSRSEVIEVCAMLGRGEVSQTAAQAAAWHLASGLSWEDLAAKDRLRLRSGYRERFFTERDVAEAAQLAERLQQRARSRSVTSPGDHPAG